MLQDFFETTVTTSEHTGTGFIFIITRWSYEHKKVAKYTLLKMECTHVVNVMCTIHPFG